MSILLDKLLVLAETMPPQITALSSESVVILLWSQQLLGNINNWYDTAEDQADVITPDDAILIERLIDDLMSSIVRPLVGTVFPYVTADPPPFTLPCDGATYAASDYPQLYALLDAAFIIDPTSFFVPDLRGRVMLGVNSDHAIGESGGEETVTLTTDTMPAHSHTSPPHAHSEIIAVDTLINGGLEAPASAATAFTGTTGLTSVTIDSAGAGEAHNNLQPYLALKYCIGAA